ncbi:hypothetical protein KCP76_17725 [Salmonella enterica subsp. enterica serovar Weltevreden]|nr:hypothetical protein KCP76_17725 [Salmonella enterica subsp. enterica serovar Weltevreden]
MATGITRYHGKRLHEPWRWAEAGVVLDYLGLLWSTTGENHLSAYEAARKGRDTGR